MESYDLEVLRADLGEKLYYFDEIGSTNEKAMTLGREGAPEGSVVLAERQTAGRGRRGAAWFCGEGSGLAFTILLRPQFERVLWPRLSLVAGVAIAKSLELAGMAPEIKWPNDVLIGGRKVCGILVEAEGDFVVVGIGLNVRREKLPKDLQGRATSLEEEGASELSREEYLLGVSNAVKTLAQSVNRGFEGLLDMVRARCALEGKEIEFLVGQASHRGLCRGIGDSGDLLVLEKGVVNRYFTADQIRVVGAARSC